MRVSMKCPTPPSRVAIGWGFVKIRVSKAPPLGLSKFEAGLQFALNDSLGKFVLRNCCQQQTCVVCHRLGKL